MGTPDDIDVWIGLDIGKAEHFADVLDSAGAPLFAGTVANDAADIEALLDHAAGLGTAALVVDQPGSLASLVLAVAARRQRARARWAAPDSPRRHSCRRVITPRRSLCWPPFSLQCRSEIASRGQAHPDRPHARRDGQDLRDHSRRSPVQSDRPDLG